MFKPFALAAVAALLASTAAHANLVQNGGFETTTMWYSGQFSTQVADWNNSKTDGYTGYGYNFLIRPGTADTTGFYSFYGNHDYLWSPKNGSDNGLTATSPTGGNYLLADGAEDFHGAITQTIKGLTVGSVYQLSFDWAAAQFYGYSGATTESWAVTLGDDTKVTATINNPSHGFSGWRTATMSFVASSTSEMLSFLAQGSPSGEPPTLLLDNVSLEKVGVPEPASLMLLATGLAGIGMIARRRRMVPAKAC